MKKFFSLFAGLFLIITSVTSCYVNRFDVGSGAQSSSEVRKRNQYFIDGLVASKVSSPAQMAEGASNYSVTIYHSFLDGVFSIITFGIYTPTTTIVKK